MRLYKFLLVDHAIDNLVKRRIKISEYSDMNDPFELAGVSLSERQYTEALREVMKGVGALCFSDSMSEPLLWSHYAEKHRGCCIAFDVAENDSLQKTISVERLEEQLVDLEPFKQYLIDAPRSGKMPCEGSDREFQKLAAVYDPVTSKVMLSKYKGWDYEREFRLQIRLVPSQKDGALYFADFDENLRPVEVLLGARCTDETVERLKYAVNRYDPPLAIIRTALAKDDFRIVRLSNAI